MVITVNGDMLYLLYILVDTRYMADFEEAFNVIIKSS